MASLKIWLSAVILCTSFFSYGQNKPLKFKTKNITVSKTVLKVAIADNDYKRARGMMFVEKWSKYQGMLFIFDKAQTRSFWMRNTLLPLSLGFYDAQKRLIETFDLTPPISLAQVTVDKAVSSEPAKYVLEVPQGWFKKHEITKGSILKGI